MDPSKRTESGPHLAGGAARSASAGPSRTVFYRRWIGACAAGEFVGIGVATAAAIAINALVGEPRSSREREAQKSPWAGVGAA